MIVQSTGTPIYDVAATTTTVTGTSTIAGTLNINGSGVYDANGDFAASGAITMDGTARLQLSAAGTGVSSLGTLDDAAGTVIYDGAGQTILSDTYNHLTLEGSGNKTADGNITVNGDFLIQNCDRYSTEGFNTNVLGSTDIDTELRITTNAGVFDADGPFDATVDTINFTTDDGTLRLATNPTSLGNLRIFTSRKSSL